MNVNAEIHHEDGMCWAEIAELPGCFASGESVPALIEALGEAIALYLAPAPGASQAAPVATCVAAVGFHVDDLALQPC